MRHRFEIRPLTNAADLTGAYLVLSGRWVAGLAVLAVADKVDWPALVEVPARRVRAIEFAAAAYGYAVLLLVAVGVLGVLL